MTWVGHSRTGRFPLVAGIFLGLGGFFDGIVLHQILQWHHIATSAGHSADSLESLEFNTLLDGLFHAAAYAFVVIGLLLLWRTAHQRHPGWSSRLLLGSVLMGFGIFNLVEGVVNHHLLGLQHVNETAPRAHWMWWDGSFLAWGALMPWGGWALVREGRRRSPGEPTP